MDTLDCPKCGAGPFKDEQYYNTHRQLHNLVLANDIMRQWGKCSIPVEYFLENKFDELEEYLKNYKPPASDKGLTIKYKYIA